MRVMREVKHYQLLAALGEGAFHAEDNELVGKLPRVVQAEVLVIPHDLGVAEDFMPLILNEFDQAGLLKEGYLLKDVLVVALDLQDP